MFLFRWLFWLGGGGGQSAATFGGTCHRAFWSWDRLYGRNRAEWLRTYRRKWDRVWRWTVPNTFPAETLTKPVSEDRDYGFDFSDAPEIQGGATISSAVIVSPPVGLTFSAVTINAALFDGIAIGKAAVVEISGGTDDVTYAFGCKATLSTGRKLVIPAKLAVTGDAE